ncbi:MAG: bifunctional [glutamate--ammonia ligase]-adenylyl-L-tyrosine phosphorylase/[glutamate--ammonia-ligase] adenylyltransferase [Rhodospirillaceae bacterium]|nr:bifunctional [glutamate--ammonia ligase]-adenylyl-L-tyrosine phosphorylase/[glutamate--ammonia-ligase] adenylyltransferase [Rhodospirillaceae bacterium]
MIYEHFIADSSRIPQAADAGAAARGLEQWLEPADDDAAIRRAIADDPVGGAILDAVFGNSPFLSRCVLRDMGFVERLLQEGADAAFATLLHDVSHADADRPSQDRLKQRLRQARSRASVTIAIADITGAWTVERVTASLADFAQAALTVAVRLLMREAADQGLLAPSDPDHPDRDCGYFVLGMGKLGGRELNYSSDIDLIVLFDTDRVPYRGSGEIGRFFIRVTRDMAGLIEQRTADGYVFRTDLRLRPDPASTPPALSVAAAITYYESVGQNWERAAMIKARPVAGDIAAGQAFLDAIRPFIWRKHLDFAAIQDIHSIKRQIHRHKGGGTIAVRGHNLKLGRGGIREIEFFAQTQQLIWGGRYPELRCHGTLDTLSALTEQGHIDAATRDEMTAAYRFLRRAEHRLQMTEDQQTHSLPEDQAALDRFATFLGYDRTSDFAAELTGHLSRVELHYGELFEESPSLTAPLPEGGTLSFTGTEDDPETLLTLSRLGFADPGRISALIRGWHHGRIRATRSARARELLTELTPALLAAFGQTASPDTAFARFGDFLSRLPAGVQVFSLLQANPSLLTLVAEIMGMAPRLAETLSRNPDLLDAVLTRDFFEPLPGPDGLTEGLRADFARARDFQDKLDVARRWANEAQFRAGVHLLRDIVPPPTVERQMSDVADAVLSALQDEVEEDFAHRHGRIEGAGLAIIAFGKFGSRELNFESDLDLVFVFENPLGIERSDGQKSLTPGHYHAQLCQRMITAITALTREGRLYEVDTRLRPRGTASAITIDLDGFIRYYQDEAWTWEMLALTRARVVTGPSAMRARLDAAIRDALTRPRDPASLYADVAAMRRRIAEAHPATSPWLVKHARGGLVDIGFIAQALQLEHGAEHPEVLTPATLDALHRLATAGLLPAGHAEALGNAARLQLDLQAMLRLTIADRFSEAESSRSLQDALARIGDAPDFAALLSKLVDAQQDVSALYRELVEDRAGTPETPTDREEKKGP